MGAHREDDEAFDAFFLGLLPKVVRLAQRMTGSRELAEDISAEAFARAFARWAMVSTLDHREAWVMRVATNLAIDLARRRHPQLRPPADAADPAEAVALRDTLVHALGALPKRQREAVVLRYLADLSESDVAAALGVKNGTVKSQLHRAALALRGELVDQLQAVTHEAQLV